jgi:hypothetical protein
MTGLQSFVPPHLVAQVSRPNMSLDDWQSRMGYVGLRAQQPVMM